MIKAAIEKIASMAENKTYEFNGEIYSDHDLCHIEKIIDKPIGIGFNTLQSIVDMIESEIEKSRQLPLYVDVKSRELVRVFTGFDSKYDRDYMYESKPELPNIELNRFIDQEQMNIMLRSQFKQNEDAEYILKLISRITDESNVTSNDNGITQTVEAKKGCALLEKVNLKPRVKLAPFRTFLEVEQPESEFILRIKEGGYIGLFEADGGVWKLDAKSKIKDFFKDKLKKCIEDGIVVVVG